MSEDDRFFVRWSRRKRSTVASQRGSPTPKIPADGAEEVASAPPRPEVGEPPPLPSIQSLDAGSDITPFLARGVPAELTREALRKAWQSDPAIRDFIGLSENSWDFNTPDGVPGFGALSREEVRRLVESVIGEPDSDDPSPDASPPAAAELPHAPQGDAMPAQAAAAAAIPATRSEAEPRPPRVAVARRRHGGALPQ